MERVEIYGHYRQADRRARQVPAAPHRVEPAAKGTPTTLRPRTPSAPHTPSHPSTPGTCTPSTPPVPSRAAKTGGTPRAAKTGLLVARTPTQRPRTLSSRAPPLTPSQPSTIDSWHMYAKYTACAEPSRQDGGTPRAAKNGLLVARTPTQRPPTPSSRAPPPTPSQPSTPGTRTPSAPPVPSRAAKTGGTPPTQRPPSVSLAKYGGQRNSQQVSAPARDECQPTSAENGAAESTGTSPELCTFALLHQQEDAPLDLDLRPLPSLPSTTALQRPTQPARRFRSAPCARTCVYSCV